MVYMSQRQNNHRDKNVNQRPPLISNERRGNHHITGQATVGPKASLSHRDKTTTGIKMLTKGHPLISNERRGNHHIRGQAAAGPKTSLYTGTAKELPLYNQVT